MKNLLLLLLITSVTFAGKITLDDGNITFKAPKGFSQMSEEILQVKYPAEQAPQFVLTNSSTQTNIAYDLKNVAVSEFTLEQMQNVFTQQFSVLVPDIEWIENKVVQLAGLEWVMIEMTSRAVDTDIHNIMLITKYNEQMLIFNFNSTKEEFLTYEKVLRKSMGSIKVK